MSRSQQDGFEARRIILLRGKSPEVLLNLGGARRSLPEVQIPRWRRVAEHLTRAVKQACDIDSVSVSSLEVPSAELCGTEVRYEIMEPSTPGDEVSRGPQWISFDSLVASTFEDSCDFEAVHRAVMQTASYAEQPSRGAFGRLGWFKDLQQWVQSEIKPGGLQLNGKFQQLNASPTFSLIRFETDGPALWFKAVGAPNTQEYPVTLALARLFSRFVPEVIGTRAECNGWLALEAEGPSLNDCQELTSWEAVAADLGEFQVLSVGKSLQLLKAGARDLRPKALSSFVQPFFRAMKELMSRQTRTDPAPLPFEALDDLSAHVQDAVTVLAATSIPITFGHLDINVGNVICSPRGSVFLDWAETFVGHPFLTFQYLLENFRRTLRPDQTQEKHFVSRYIQPWRALLSEPDICRSLELSPLVAVFACATGNDLWKDAPNFQELEAAGYLRSLARRMQREALGLKKRSVPCAS